MESMLPLKFQQNSINIATIEARHNSIPILKILTQYLVNLLYLQNKNFASYKYRCAAPR